MAFLFVKRKSPMEQFDNIKSPVESFNDAYEKSRHSFLDKHPAELLEDAQQEENDTFIQKNRVGRCVCQAFDVYLSCLKTFPKNEKNKLRCKNIYLTYFDKCMKTQ